MCGCCEGYMADLVTKGAGVERAVQPQEARTQFTDRHADCI